MTFHADLNKAHKIWDSLTPEDLCFECGELITSSGVQYDGHATYDSTKAIYFHPKCASLVGQRLIADGFPNRHERK